MKPPCHVCKTSSWKAVKLTVSGTERAVFECGGCGGLFLSKPEEMAYWRDLDGWRPLPTADSSSVTLGT